MSESLRTTSNLTDVYIDASEANKDKEIIRYSKGKSGKLIVIFLCIKRLIFQV